MHQNLKFIKNKKNMNSKDNIGNQCSSSNSNFQEIKVINTNYTTVEDPAKKDSNIVNTVEENNIKNSCLEFYNEDEENVRNEKGTTLWLWSWS